MSDPEIRTPAHPDPVGDNGLVKPSPQAEPYAVPDHQAGDYANATEPTCDKTCTCRHGQPDAPAPYWTQQRERENFQDAES